jgi:hypothetical protein
MAAFFALNKKNSRINNIMLISLLLVFAVIAAGTLLTSNRLFYATTAQQQRIIFVFEQSAFLVGPLLFFYIKTLLFPIFHVRIMDWIHFAPFVLAIYAATFIERTMELFTLWMYPGRIYMSGAIVPQTILCSLRR